jgi:hypothetical protein
LPDGQEDKGEKRARYGSATDAARVDAASALINGGKRRAGCASGNDDAAAEFRERLPMAAEGTRRSGAISSFQRRRCHHALFRLIAATFRRRAPARCRGHFFDAAIFFHAAEPSAFISFAAFS